MENTTTNPLNTKAFELIKNSKAKINDPKIHFHPDIPAKMLDKVLSSYAKAAQEQGETVLLVMDETLLAGNAADGFVVTEKAIYWHNMGETQAMVPLTDIQSINYKKGLLVKSLVINGQREIISTSPKPEAMELVVELVNALRADNPIMTSTGDQQAAKLEMAPPLKFAKNRSDNRRTQPNKQKWIIALAIVAICLIFCYVLKEHVPNNHLTDAGIAYQAAVAELQKRGISTDTCDCYCLKIDQQNGAEKTGNLYINKEIIQYVFGKQFIYEHAYRAKVKIGSQKATVLELEEISEFPQEASGLNFEFTAYGEERSKERAAKVLNELYK